MSIRRRLTVVFLLAMGSAFVPAKGHPAQTSVFLHSNGTACTTSPSTGVTLLVMDTQAPTATQAKCRDSASLTRTTYKDIGTWALAVGDAKVLAALGDLHLWIGLRSAADLGANFDLKAVLKKNGVVIAAAATTNITGVTQAPTEVTLPYGPIADAQLEPADIVTVTIQTKITAQGGLSTASGLRLYYDAVTRATGGTADLTPVQSLWMHSNGDLCLTGPAANATTFGLDTTIPTSLVAKCRDSAAVNRLTYQEIGTWTRTVGQASTVTGFTDLHAWIGLKNSDDTGTYFDLRAELSKNGVVVASGETKTIQGVVRNPLQAKRVRVAFGAIATQQLVPGDVLSLKILTKVADSGGHNNAVGLRLYYDAIPIGSSRLGLILGSAGADTTPPVITITAPQNNAITNQPIATVTGTVDDPSAVVVVNGIAAPLSGNTFTATLTLVEGSNTITATATDPAGNVGTASVTVVLDTTLPIITFSANPPANAAGWNNTDVTITFTCSDAGSGIATCPTPVVVNTEAANQVVTGIATDRAGNTATASVTLSLDRTPPALDAAMSPQPNAAGWHNSDTTVSFTATDNLSGVETVTPTTTVTTDGDNQSVIGRATDRAGNSVSTTVTVNLDKTAPLVTATLSQQANAAGWHKQDVGIAYTCSDALSGIAICPDSAMVTTEGADQPVSGTATDVAGNSASASVTVSLDKTPPVIAAALSAQPNAAGWHSQDVGVTYTCNDALSGVATCPDPSTVTTEGAAQPVTGTATDVAGNSASASVVVNLDKTSPVVAITSPSDGAQVTDTALTVTGTATDVLSGVATVDCNGTPAALDNGTATCSLGLTLGSNPIELHATDAAGNTGSSNITVAYVQPNQPPIASAGGPYSGTAGDTIAFDGSGSTDPDNDPLTFTWDFGDGTNGTGPNPSHAYATAGNFTVTVTVNDGEGGVQLASASATITQGSQVVLPPDPVTVAPVLDLGVATNMASSTAFLYTGTDPIQTGVAPGTIEARRAAVLRGKLMERDGQPLPGATVTVHSHPEFGQTLSRADGMFDLAVNGGGQLTLQFAKAGYINAQRQVDVPWQDFVVIEDVALVPYDTRSTVIDLTPLCDVNMNCVQRPIQVAQGNPVTDDDGTRQATLLVAPNTTVMMVMPDGTSQFIQQFTVRATEFTVGPNGPQAMPAQLPPTSGYTYAVDFSVDEAKAAGAVDVRFDPPLPFYVENFLGFSVGIEAPLGAYDPVQAAWVASDSGRVIGIVSITNGMADVDVTGDGIADNVTVLATLGITDAERQQLAVLYQPGQTLWRTRIPHFDWPWDVNWGFDFPANAVAAGVELLFEKLLSDPCTQPGSIIECENQILGEAVGVVGTPFGLSYQSERVPGRKVAYQLDIPLSGSEIPPSLKRIELEIGVAGRLIRYSFLAAPNKQFPFTWDGKDIYGRTVQGVQPVMVRIGYTYDAVYERTGRFGYNGNGQSVSLVPVLGRQQLTIWRKWEGSLGAWDARPIGLGGWMLTSHHAYDPAERIVHFGSGGRQQAEEVIGPTIRTVAGPGQAGFANDNGTGCYNGEAVPAVGALVCPVGLAVAPDGSVYFTQGPLNQLVRKVGPDGRIRTVAGNGFGCNPFNAPCGDGGPATQASINDPRGLALGLDNSLYIYGGSRIRRVTPDGIIRTFAGTGVAGFSGDGGPATQAQFSPGAIGHGVAVAPDGSVYFVDQGNRRIRRVGTDGIITTVAGTGARCGIVPAACGDGGPATAAGLGDGVTGIAVGRDGSVYFTDNDFYVHRIRRITPDGIIRTIAGTGAPGFSGDGGLATLARLNTPTGIAVGPDDTVYVADTGNYRIRWIRPGGVIATLAGTGEGRAGDGGLALRATLQGLRGVAVAPDGSVYFSQVPRLSVPLGFDPDTRIRRIAPIADRVETAGVIIPAEDGSEAYILTPDGRHLRTQDAITGALREQFTYDSAGRLASVTDGNGNVTTIERDASGNPTAIIGPFGQRTELALNPDGYLERITSPAGEAVQLTYTPDGLLTSITNPRGYTSSYAYDALGRLTNAMDSTGAFKTLDRTGTNTDYTVTVLSPMGRPTSHRVERLSNGDQRRTTTDAAGISSQTISRLNGTQTATYPDGTTVTVTLGPDPRWGMRVPLASSVVVTTPGGKTHTTTTARTTTLSNSSNILSLSTINETVTINGRAFVSAYTASNRTFTHTTPTGRRTTTVVDTLGRPVQSQFDTLAPNSVTYDARGRVAAATQGTGASSRTATFAYSGSGFLESVTDAINRTMSMARDTNGRVTAQTFPDGRQAQFAYDANGNVTSIIPPDRPDHSFAYTQRDEVSTYTPPTVSGGDGPSQFAYNPDRQPTQMNRPDGSSVGYQYDTAGRLSVVELTSGDLSFGYDTAGRLATLDRDQGLSLAYAYDGGLPTGTTWSGTVAGSVTLVYDNSFRVTTQLVNGGNSIAVQYNTDSLPTQVGGLTLTRNAQTGFITGTVLGTTTDAITYDTLGALASYTASQSGSGVYSATYARDSLNRITNTTETIGGAVRTLSYTYDLAGRLTEVRESGVLTATYTYDANGNRLSRTDGGGTTNATYDAQDRLIQYGTTTYTHTPNGERQSKTAGGQTTTYQYDSVGNLTGVMLPNGTQIEYLLDGQNRRIGMRVDGILVQAFLYQDGLRPIVELDGAGNVVSRFVYGAKGNVPDYFVKSGVTYRIISDRLGSPRLVIDVATGVVAQRMDYDEFGNVLLDTNPGFQPFGFAGGLFDSLTGLVHFGAREYDPEAGRWTTKDPIGFADGDGNLYAYVTNDPVNFLDPAGLEPYKFYETEEEAARQALLDIWLKSMLEGVEYGGTIFIDKKGRGYFYIPANRGHKEGVRTYQECERGIGISRYHTHPRTPWSQEGLSEVDIAQRAYWLREEDHRYEMSYLGTPNFNFMVLKYHGMVRGRSLGGVWREETLGNLGGGPAVPEKLGNFFSLWQKMTD